MNIHEEFHKCDEYTDAMEYAIHWQNSARKNPRQKNILAAMLATDEYHAIAEEQGVPMSKRPISTTEAFLASLDEEIGCPQCNPAKCPSDWNSCIFCGRDLRENTQ